MCQLAADGRRLADFGFRRAHGIETGVEAALAAHVGGGFATSNVEAGRRYGIPTTGTMAHSYVQAFRDERDAFRSFATDHPDQSVLLAGAPAPSRDHRPLIMTTTSPASWSSHMPAVPSTCVFLSGWRRRPRRPAGPWRQP